MPGCPGRGHCLGAAALAAELPPAGAARGAECEAGRGGHLALGSGGRSRLSVEDRAVGVSVSSRGLGDCEHVCVCTSFVLDTGEHIRLLPPILLGASGPAHVMTTPEKRNSAPQATWRLLLSVTCRGK